LFILGGKDVAFLSGPPSIGVDYGVTILADRHEELLGVEPPSDPSPFVVYLGGLLPAEPAVGKAF
jgi:hypothetical protein